MENPSGTTVAQWTNAAAASGLHQMELQLAKEPDQVNQYECFVILMRDLLSTCFYLKKKGILVYQDGKKRGHFQQRIRSPRVRSTKV